MKNALISISILLFLSCNQPQKQGDELKDTINAKPSEKTEEPLLLKHANQDDSYTKNQIRKKTIYPSITSKLIL